MLEDYAARARRKGAKALEATILRTRSEAGRDILAFLASNGRMDLDQVLGVVRGWSRPGDSSLIELGDLHPDWAGRLARVLALQNLRPSDQTDALWLLRTIGHLHGLSRLEPEVAKVFGDVLFKLRRFRDLEDLLPRLPLSAEARVQLETDLRNPFTNPPGKLDSWLRALSRVLGLSAHGLEALQLSDEGGTPFDRLLVEPSKEVSGPLVSVILTSYRPGQALLTAVRSIARQSYTNLEILLVDDGSAPEFDNVLKEAQKLDKRIRLIKLASNGGTYRARNIGLSLARGRFATFQDSDDWSHPRRIEMQLAPLLSDPDLMATRSFCVRASEDLELTRVGYSFRHINTSSLMIRTSDVLAKIGFIDEARKSADNEYVERLRVVFRGGLANIEQPALSIVRLAPGSLSRSDFRPGWQHGSRFGYKSAYAEWHRRIANGASPFLDPHSPTQPFARPLSMRDEAHGNSYDVVFVGDWRQLGGPQHSMLAEIRAVRRRGLRVGVAHLEAFRFMTVQKRMLCRPIQELINAGEVDFVLLDDHIDVDLVAIRYPPILQFPPASRSNWDVSYLWIVANQAPFENDGTDYRYDVADCTNNAEYMFNCRPVWVPQGPAVRKHIAPLLSNDQLASFNNFGIIDPHQWCIDRSRVRSRPVVIGRYSRDYELKFPATLEQLLGAYPDAPDIRVRMMGAIESVSTLLEGRSIPENWELLPYNAVPTKTFLQDIDFFVYFDNPRIVEAFGRSILEAVASGAVVILPERYRDTFAEAAIYAVEDDVEEIVRYLHRHPDAYRQQVDRARMVLNDRFSDKAFLDRLRPFVSDLAEAQARLDTSANAPAAAGALRSVTRPAKSGASTVVDFRYGYLISESTSPGLPAGWSATPIGDVLYSRHPDSRIGVAEVPGNGLRSPQAVVVVGDAVDVDAPSTNLDHIASRAAKALRDEGVDGATRYVSNLAGRFICVLHVESVLHVIPDLQASQPAFARITDGRLAISSHALLTDRAFGTLPSPLEIHHDTTDLFDEEWSTKSKVAQAVPNSRLEIDIHKRTIRLVRFYPESDPVVSVVSGPDRLEWLRRYWQLLPKNDSIGLCLDDRSAPWLEHLLPLMGTRLFAYTVLGEDASLADVQHLTAHTAELGVPHRIIVESDSAVGEFERVYESTWTEPSVWASRSKALYEALPPSLLLEQLGPQLPNEAFDPRLPPLKSEAVASYRVHTGLDAGQELGLLDPDALARWEMANAIYWNRRAQEGDLRHRILPLLPMRRLLQYGLATDDVNR